MAIKTSSAKAKGRKFQQHVAKRIEEEMDLREGDVESRPMGSAGLDIMMSAHAREKFPVAIECKKTKSTPGTPEMKQAKANTFPDGLPAVIWCPHGKGPQHARMMIDFEEFIQWWKTHGSY